MTKRRLLVDASVRAQYGVAVCHDLLSKEQMPSEPAVNDQDSCALPIDCGRCCRQPRHLQPGWRPIAERGLDSPNVGAARKGAREIAKKLRADGMFTFGFSDWQMTTMNEDGKAVTEFALEEHDGM